MVRFENTKTAYKLKTDQELRKAYLLFRLFSKQLLVRFGGKLVLFLLRLRIPIKGILKNTVYQSFVQEPQKMIQWNWLIYLQTLM